METRKTLTPPRSITYCLMGDPVPLARARHGHGRVFDAQKELKLVAGISLRQQHNDQPLFAGPLHMDVHFYLPIARSAKKTRSGSYHIFRPDLSNLLKFTEDVANSVIYADDCLIASVSATKTYDSNPRTVFTITEIKYK